MKRIGLLLLAVVMVAGFAGCNSGGEDGYNFNGSWVITKNLTSSRCTWSYDSSQQISIQQNGSNCVISYSDIEAQGICNPSTGSISWTYEHGKYNSSINGNTTDSYTVNGSETTTIDGTSCFANFSLTMERL